MSRHGDAGGLVQAVAELDALFGLEGPALPAALNAVDRRLAQLDGGPPSSHASDAAAHVSLAKAFWGQRGITWHEAFLDILAADYGTGMHTVDYVTDPEACRVQINAWVEEQPHGRILELLERGSVSGDHLLVLTNALWFKARWLHMFLDVANGLFTTSSGERLDVARMSASPERCSYEHGAGWQSIRIPYVGG